MLRIYAVVLDVLRGLRPVVTQIETHDRDLGRQLRRAATSVALNMQEGSGSSGGTRRERYRNALGSARETGRAPWRNGTALRARWGRATTADGVARRRIIVADESIVGAVLRSLAFAAVTGVVLASSVAAAAPTGRLIYSRASDVDSCPDEETLRHAVAARVGYDPFFAWARRTVVVNVVRRRQEFVATVNLIDEQSIAHGARELRTGGECRELLDAVALAIAIAIDPQILAHPPESSAPVPPPPPPSTVIAAPPPVAAPPASPVERGPSPPPSAAPTAFEASIGLVASSGDAPNMAAGLSAGGAVRWAPVSVGLEGRVDAPATESATGGGQVSSQLVVVAVVPCRSFGPFAACAVVQGGAMRAWSNGVPDRRTAWTESWEVGGRAGVFVPVATNLFLRVRTDILGNLHRASLELRGTGVWPAAPVTSCIGVDAVLRFR